MRTAYRAFDRRDVDAALELVHADVDWPNAWEGGRVIGHAAVGEYWRRRFEAISSQVEVESITVAGDGIVLVRVHQLVRDARTAELLSDSHVCHILQLEDGLIVRMDVVGGADAGGSEGRQVWMPGRVRTEIQLTSADTAGAYCLLVDEPSAGWALPSHRHRDEAETIHVIEGRFEMTVDGERRELAEGETIHVPAGVSHSGRNVGTDPGKRVVIFSPGGMERFFLEVGQADPNAKIDLQAALEASARYGWEFEREDSRPSSIGAGRSGDGFAAVDDEDELDRGWGRAPKEH